MCLSTQYLVAEQTDMRSCPALVGDKTAGGMNMMKRRCRQQNDVQKKEELGQRLKKETVNAMMEIQNDIRYMGLLNGPKHVLENASDDIFDAVEQAFVNIAREGRPLQEGDPAYEVFPDIAASVVYFLEKIASDWIELDRILNKKCMELAKSSPE